MTETSINYAKALYELSVPEEAVLETEKIFRSTPQLKGALENPLVSLKEKEHVIDRVFPQEMKNFLKVTCKYQKISSIYDILEAYGNYSRKQKGILKARKADLCIFGFLSVFLIYGGIMNPASALMAYGTITWQSLLAFYISGAPVDLVHALSTVIFLWFLSRPLLEKLERIKKKYGLIESQKEEII